MLCPDFLAGGKKIDKENDSRIKRFFPKTLVWFVVSLYVLWHPRAGYKYYHFGQFILYWHLRDGVTILSYDPYSNCCPSYKYFQDILVLVNPTQINLSPLG